MSLPTAAEYALMLTDPGPPRSAPGPGKLSARERELVTLVPRAGPTPRSPSSSTSASRTISSHLDRIRDKTGCRCRSTADRQVADDE